MNIESHFSNFISWLGNTELFERPLRQIPGKWQLYEYYIEPENRLIHFKEDQLINENLYWEIEFAEEEQLFQKTNILLPFSNETGELKWKRSGIYITFIDSGSSWENIQFRYAVAKSELRLLKKDTSGKIEFFGFFKRINR